MADAVTFDTVESAPDMIWHEWLSSFFDGDPHALVSGGTPRQFPSASFEFGSGSLPKPLQDADGYGVGISVVTETTDERTWLADDAKEGFNQVTWSFYIRSKVSQTSKGNERYQSRQAAELLRGLLMSPFATKTLSQKGLRIVEVKRAAVGPVNDYALRIVRVQGLVEWDGGSEE